MRTSRKKIEELVSILNAQYDIQHAKSGWVPVRNDYIPKLCQERMKEEWKAYMKDDALQIILERRLEKETKKRRRFIEYTPKWMLLRKRIAYIDRSNTPFSMGIFDRKKIPVNYYSCFRLATESDHKYIMILCSIWAWDYKRFDKYFDQIEENMLITGHNDYEKIVDSFIEAQEVLESMYMAEKEIERRIKPLKKFVKKGRME